MVTIFIKLINAAVYLAAKGIDLDTGAGVDALQVALNEATPIASWGYNFGNDELMIEAPEGTDPYAFSEFGEVSTVNGSTSW